MTENKQEVCHACGKEVDQSYCKTILLNDKPPYIRGRMCPECHTKKAVETLVEVGYEVDAKNGLVKLEGDNYWIPIDYIIWSDSFKIREREEDDHINLKFPEVILNPETKLFEVTLIGADSGGYDVQDFTVYFETLEEVIAALIGGVNNKIRKNV